MGFRTVQAGVLAVLGIVLVGIAVSTKQIRVGVLGVVFVAYAVTIYALARWTAVRSQRDDQP